MVTRYESQRREVVWSSHLAMSLLEDLEYAIDISDTKSAEALGRAFIVSVRSLARTLWPGTAGNEEGIRSGSEHAASLRRSLGVTDNSALSPARLGLIDHAAGKETAGDTDGNGLEQTGSQAAGQCGLDPIINEVRRLWARLDRPGLLTATAAGVSGLQLVTERERRTVRSECRTRIIGTAIHPAIVQIHSHACIELVGHQQ
jgi:hypothetical protein